MGLCLQHVTKLYVNKKPVFGYRLQQLSHLRLHHSQHVRNVITVEKTDVTEIYLKQRNEKTKKNVNSKRSKINELFK